MFLDRRRRTVAGRSKGNTNALKHERAIRSLEGWAILVLLEAGAIRECEQHGWMQDRSDPHARERAFDIACRALQEPGPVLRRFYPDRSGNCL